MSITPISDVQQNEFFLLSCIFLDNKIAKYVQSLLDPSFLITDFYRDVYKTICELTNNDSPIDRLALSTIINEKKSQGTAYKDYQFHHIQTQLQILESEARRKFISTGGDKTFLYNIVNQYITTIKNYHIRNKLESITQDIKDNPESSSIIENLQREVNSLNTNYKPNSINRLSDILLDVANNADKLTQSSNGLAGLSTGITDLDKAIGGLANSDLIIMAGRPGMGKTSLATDIACHVAKENQVIFFSLEMSRHQLGARIMAGASGIPSELIRNGRLTPDDFLKFITVIKQHTNTNLFIDDMPPNNVDDFYVRAKRVVKERNAKLIIIDYLQLLRSSGKYQQSNKVSEITDISRTLKMLAKELDVPIIALSQLNRSSENREDKRPQLSDLRDSGSIEQDADIVMFIYRESYYASREEPTRHSREEEHKYQDRLAEWQLYKERIANEADIIIAKHRHGATTEVKLSFNPRLTKFGNHEKSRYSATQY